MNPSEYSHEVLWDSALDSCNSSISEVKSIMAKAFKGPLTAIQQQLLNNALLNDPNLVHHTGLTPSKVRSLFK